MRKTIILKALFISIICCFLSKDIYATDNIEDLKGFVFIDISKIYHHNGEVIIYSEKKDTILKLVNKNIILNGFVFEIIEEEFKYKKNINVEVFDPEYGFFILQCIGFIKGFYKVEINGNVGLIKDDLIKEFVEYKDLQKFVLETYPIPTPDNPLRLEPNDTSEIIKGFAEWTYISVEIIGDWLKVKDNKDCYIGKGPSKDKIIGWIRWRKNGKLFLKYGLTC